jgi:hypothetical protein
MKRASVVAAILLLTVVGVAQQPSNPPKNTANPNDQLDLLERRRETTITGYTEDGRTYRRSGQNSGTIRVARVSGMRDHADGHAPNGRWACSMIGWDVRATFSNVNNALAAIFTRE